MAVEAEEQREARLQRMSAKHDYTEEKEWLGGC